MARVVAQYGEEGLINIIGGCCGTTPAHLAAIVAAVLPHSPRALETQAA
jgi:5-methyltetrahydrofolate--homocysteine methyltransferase